MFPVRSWSRALSVVSTPPPRYCESIKLRDKTVNAFVTVAPDPSKQQGDLDRPSTYFTIAIKDNICTSDLPTTCSSSMLSDFRPPFDATVVELLKNAGAVIVGKTNCDEFGMGSNNLHSFFGPVINPYQSPASSFAWTDRKRHSAGGSSGGSAAAVASGMCYAALSTDTGGSTRLPASYCGVVGLKPSYGMISRWGVVAFADSLDCVGIIAKDVSTVETVFDILSQHDSKDSTSATPDVRVRAQLICNQAMAKWPFLKEKGSKSLNGLRIGIPQEYFPSEIQPSMLLSFRSLLSRLQSLGATLVSVSLPSTQYGLSAYYVIASAEASSNLARYDGVRFGKHVAPTRNSTKTADIYAATRSKHLGDEVKRRILLGTYALTADAFNNYFLKAQHVRETIKSDFNAVFRIPNPLYNTSFHSPSAEKGSSPPQPNEEGVDLLLHLASINTAPSLESLATSDPEGLNSYVQDVLTVPASLAGLPAMSVPAGLSRPLEVESTGPSAGWPVGVSVVGQWGCERMVTTIGKVIEGLMNSSDQVSGTQDGVEPVISGIKA